MAGKARSSFGVFRAFAMAHENRTERQEGARGGGNSPPSCFFFIFKLGRTQSASGLYG